MDEGFNFQVLTCLKYLGKVASYKQIDRWQDDPRMRD